MTKKEIDKFIELTKKYFRSLSYQQYPGSPIEKIVDEIDLEGYEEYIRRKLKE